MKTSKHILSLLLSISILTSLTSGASASNYPPTMASFNEYDYIELLEESTSEDLDDIGITMQEAENIISEFENALFERASLPESDLRAYGYNDSEIELLHAYANGQELSTAELRAVSSTCTGEISRGYVTATTANFTYKWTWDRCPVITLSDASAMKWIAYDSNDQEIGVQQTSVRMNVHYYYKGNAAMEGGKMFDMDGENEPNLDFNVLNMKFPVSLAYSSQSGIIFDCYSKTGEVTVSVKIPDGSTQNQSIHHIFIAGLYGHTLVGIGSPSVSISAGSIGISFTGNTSIDSIASRRATIYRDKTTVEYW